MSISIVSTGLSKLKNPDHLKSLPEFRKATRNMTLSWLALQEALDLLPSFSSKTGLDDVGIVLGSGFGELDVTKDFLKGLSEYGIGRPILFQNSLHNSILGFLTMKMKFTGPSITVSNRCFTGESSLEIAVQLLHHGHCHFCIVIGVDTWVSDLNPALCQIYPTPVVLGEGAAALILANEEGLKKSGYSAFGTLDKVTTETRPGKLTGASGFTAYYEADAIEKLVEDIRSSTKINGKVQPLLLPKPDGTSSEIHWQPREKATPKGLEPPTVNS